jgi:hypothetical protein
MYGKKYKKIWQELETHPFYLAVDKGYIPIVKKINILNKNFGTMFTERKNVKKINLTPQEYYCYLVFGKLMTFSNIYRTMRQAQIYISEVSSPRKHEKYGIHRFDYITYHYAVHTLSYVSIIDVVLILINTVFELGLKDEQCTYKSVSNKIKSKSILKDLDNLRKTIDKYKPLRNQFVHHGKLPNIIDINNSEVLYLLQLFKSQSKESIKIRNELSEGIKFMYKAEAESIVNKLKSDTALIEKDVSNLLYHLLPIYNLYNHAYQKDIRIEENRLAG